MEFVLLGYGFVSLMFMFDLFLNAYLDEKYDTKEAFLIDLILHILWPVLILHRLYKYFSQLED